MCCARCVPDGPSTAPTAIPIQSRNTGSQNRVEPQVPQKPRRTFSEDWNQRRDSSPVTVSADFGTSVEAKKWPDCLRHWLQWQASGGLRGVLTSNLIAPQRQDPWGMATPCCLPQAYACTDLSPRS